MGKLLKYAILGGAGYWAYLRYQEAQRLRVPLEQAFAPANLLKSVRQLAQAAAAPAPPAPGDELLPYGGGGYGPQRLPY